MVLFKLKGECMRNAEKYASVRARALFMVTCFTLYVCVRLFL